VSGEEAVVLTLYHAPFSRSLRVRWLLEELGVPYRLETRRFAELRRPEHRALHPLGKVPVLVDGELVLFESGAIVQYVLERYAGGRLEPKPGSPERALHLQWLHYAEATMTPPLGLIVRHTALLPEAERIPAVVEHARTQAADVLAPVERALAGRSWLLPEFGAADVMMGYSVKLASLLGLVGDGQPNLAAYLARCEERPAFRRAAG
jgi:glutathione S-transferase